MSNEQKEYESLLYHTDIFKVANNVMESHISEPSVLSKFVEQMDDYNVTN